MSNRLQFCEHYDYPPAITRHFERILEPMEADKVRSVLLLGGTSRGELSYVTKDDDLWLLSDYEFLVVSNTRSPLRYRYERRLEEHFSELERQISPESSTFHIDFNYVTHRELRNMKRAFFTYEAKREGVTIWGEDVRDQIPDVTLQNLDRREINEVLIWRLWELLLNLPPEMFTDRSLSTTDLQTYLYVVCKNTLDLTTWLVPHEGELISSFTDRVSYLDSNFDNLKCRKYFDSDFPEFLQLCLQGKMNAKVEEYSPIKLYEDSLSRFENATWYLLDTLPNRELSGRGNGLPSRPIIENSSKLFRDTMWKRLLYDSYLSVRNCSSLNQNPLSWFRSGKHGLNLLCLLHLNRSTVLFLRNDTENALAELEIANEYLQRISFESVSLTGSFRDDYVRVRRVLSEFMYTYHPWIKGQQERIQTIQQEFENKTTQSP